MEELVLTEAISPVAKIEASVITLVDIAAMRSANCHLDDREEGASYQRQRLTGTAIADQSAGTGSHFS